MKKVTGRRKAGLLALICASGMTSACANMGAGGYLGALAGAAAGAYAGSEVDGPDGDGTMTLVGGVIGGSLGMVLGSGAVTPGEMVQAAGEARVAETVAEGIQERDAQRAELERLRLAAERETAEKQAGDHRTVAERNQQGQNLASSVAPPPIQSNSPGAQVTASARNAGSTSTAGNEGFARYIWCFARRSVMGKQGDQHYSNINRVFITYKQSQENQLEYRVRDRWAEYLQQFQNMSDSNSYQTCNLYETYAQAQARLDEEMINWKRLAPVNATLWDPQI